MAYQEVIDKIKPEMDKVIGFLEKEFAKFRPSRATPSLVEDVIVECFGQRFPLKQLASIAIPEPRQIVIQPWDKSYIEGIVKALERTGIGASPVVDKDAVRINLPPLTEEYRKDLMKVVSQKQEEAKKTIRRWREDGWAEIQKQAKEGKIREDDKFKGKEALQKLVDEYNKKIEEMGEKKKKDVAE